MPASGAGRGCVPGLGVEGFFIAAPCDFSILDSELRYLQVNETLAYMNRATVADLRRTIDEVVPALPNTRHRSRRPNHDATGAAFDHEAVNARPAGCPSPRSVLLMRGLVGVNT